MARGVRWPVLSRARNGHWLFRGLSHCRYARLGEWRSEGDCYNKMINMKVSVLVSGVPTACLEPRAHTPCTHAHHTMRPPAPIPAQLFWSGMHMGFLMRQQCIAAIHSKVLRLNSAAIAHVSSGHVVNLVSNDVRRFDDAMPYWMFLWAGGWARWSLFRV